MKYDDKIEQAENLIKQDKYKEAFDIFCELREERPKVEYVKSKIANY
jgi:hypothetical protein